MKHVLVSASLVALALTLTGCGDEPEAGPAEQGGEAAGEVLGGTISDDMIPLEQLRSQSPPAERVTTTTTTQEVENEDGSTGVETTVATTTTNSDGPAPPAPAPPLTPAPPVDD